MGLSDNINYDDIHDIPRGPFTPTATFQPTITITREVLPVAIRHGCELWWDNSAQEKRLDQRDGKDGFTRFVNARVEGKIAEVAVSALLEEAFDVKSAVDWRIYGDYTETDHGDLQYLQDTDGNQYKPAVEFDTKKTKPWNQWLLVRDGILNGFDTEVPIILTKLSIPGDIELDKFESYNTWNQVDVNETFRERILDFAATNFPLDVECVGSVYTDEFTDTFEKGSRLYDPSTGTNIGSRLRCKNKGIHVSEIPNTPVRWNRVVNDIIGDNPIEYTPLPITDG